MRLKFNKEIEFFFKKFFFPEGFLLKRRLQRSIKRNDEQEINLVKKFIKSGTDSIDVGVYRGVYSYEMSKYSEKVHSFEPNPIIFKYINKNLKKFIKNIHLYNFALSNQNKTINLKIPIRNSNSNKEIFEEYYEMGKATIHNENNFENYENFEIQTKKIDEFSFDNKISFIKIDVEGHELEVIEGAKNTIKRDKPVLLVEIEKQYTKKEVAESINFINSLGYKSYFFNKKDLKSTTELNNLDLFNNFIFFPK
tara:strand:- start:1011 stop:1766 length:756 start_codon:yes stop_codon:yes gene_type:complete